MEAVLRHVSATNCAYACSREGSALEMGKEMSILVKRLNEGASNINLNFGIAITPPAPPPASTGQASAAKAASVEDTDVTIDNDDFAVHFLEWCKNSTCVAGQDCELLLGGLGAGVTDDGNPIVPFPEPFCESVQTMNDNSCFCGNEMLERFPGASILLDNIEMVSMMCQFTENTGVKGSCA